MLLANFNNEEIFFSKRNWATKITQQFVAGKGEHRSLTLLNGHQDDKQPKHVTHTDSTTGRKSSNEKSQEEHCSRVVYLAC